MAEAAATVFMAVGTPMVRNGGAGVMQAPLLTGIFLKEDSMGHQMTIWIVTATPAEPNTGDRLYIVGRTRNGVR